MHVESMESIPPSQTVFPPRDTPTVKTASFETERPRPAIRLPNTDADPPNIPSAPPESFVLEVIILETESEAPPEIFRFTDIGPLMVFSAVTETVDPIEDGPATERPRLTKQYSAQDSDPEAFISPLAETDFPRLELPPAEKFEPTFRAHAVESPPAIRQLPSSRESLAAVMSLPTKSDRVAETEPSTNIEDTDPNVPFPLTVISEPTQAPPDMDVSDLPIMRPRTDAVEPAVADPATDNAGK
jgi:hypothetical protein